MLLTPEEMKALGLTEQPWAVVTGELRRNKLKLKLKIMKPIPTAEQIAHETGLINMSALSRTGVVQVVLDHLKPWLSAGTRPAPSGLPWVSLKERKPTKEDTDAGVECVIVTDGTTYWRSAITNLSSATHFLPFSPPAQPSQDELDRAAFEKEFPDLNLSEKNPIGDYVNAQTAIAWLAFKRALDLTRIQS